MTSATGRKRPTVSMRLALRALRQWDRRQMLGALLASILIALVVGVATVLIPNPIFGRDIPPVWWNYPAWILTSLLTGLLIATYIRPSEPSEIDTSAKIGGIASIVGWFAVGCPVCNKIALLALGYGGAITWFAPLQPILAVVAVGLSCYAVVWRLSGQVACPVRLPRSERREVTSGK